MQSNQTTFVCCGLDSISPHPIVYIKASNEQAVCPYCGEVLRRDSLVEAQSAQGTSSN